MIENSYTDSDLYKPFWVSASRGELCFPKCLDCHRFHWYPMERCPYCLGTTIEWTKVEPVGSIFTFTTVRHVFDSSFDLPIPYVIALIEFEAAPEVRLISNIIDDIDKLEIGMRVRALFQLNDEKWKVLFKPIRTPK
jgi:uncharacterized OB-fold protein